jgi:hypothetical protein
MPGMRFIGVLAPGAIAMALIVASCGSSADPPTAAGFLQLQSSIQSDSEGSFRSIADLTDASDLVVAGTIEGMENPGASPSVEGNPPLSFALIVIHPDRVIKGRPEPGPDGRIRVAVLAPQVIGFEEYQASLPLGIRTLQFLVASEDPGVYVNPTDLGFILDVDGTAKSFEQGFDPIVHETPEQTIDSIADVAMGS